MSQPNPIDTIKTACNEYAQFVNLEDFGEDGMSYYENAVVEAAMEVYCPGFYSKLNKRLING